MLMMMLYVVDDVDDDDEVLDKSLTQGSVRVGSPREEFSGSGLEHVERP